LPSGLKSTALMCPSCENERPGGPGDLGDQGHLVAARGQDVTAVGAECDGLDHMLMSNRAGPTGLPVEASQIPGCSIEGPGDELLATRGEGDRSDAVLMPQRVGRSAGRRLASQRRAVAVVTSRQDGSGRRGCRPRDETQSLWVQGARQLGHRWWRSPEAGGLVPSPRSGRSDHPD